MNVCSPAASDRALDRFAAAAIVVSRARYTPVGHAPSASLVVSRYGPAPPASLVVSRYGSRHAHSISPVVASGDGAVCWMPSRTIGPATCRAPAPPYQPMRKMSIEYRGAVVLMYKSIGSPPLTLVFDAYPSISPAGAGLVISQAAVPGF